MVPVTQKKHVINTYGPNCQTIYNKANLIDITFAKIINMEIFGTELLQAWTSHEKKRAKAKHKNQLK